MVFKKFDTDGSNSLDKEEFKKLIVTANTTVEEFMKGEMAYVKDVDLL
jgi:Ca2+-binding EF-hand superfamily protein